MTKNSNEQCSFPSWLSSLHHDWRSIDDSSSLHVNRHGHSLKLRNISASGETVDTHATCHRVEDMEIVSRDGGREKEVVAAKVVVHVKSGW